MKKMFIFLSLFLITACASDEAIKADYIITDAWIIDGSGGERRIGDVVVVGDQIAFVGTDHSYTSERVIDAKGKVLTPGFIDPHAHGDPFRTPEFENFIAQGVTTICLGQDGSSTNETSMGDWFTAVDSLDLGVNVATLIGHGTIRKLSEIPSAQAPTSEQQQRMEDLLSAGIEAGAFGMSTGLEYVPGYYSGEEELLSLAKVVGAWNGLIMSHNRNEDDYAVNESVRELIRQGQHCRVQVSHLKVVYGKGAARAKELLHIIDSARAAGIDVYADVYPYTASHTGIGIVFLDYSKPPNDFDKVRTERRGELKKFITDKVNYRNGPEATLFGTNPWAGKTLKQVADSLGKDFADVLIDVIGPNGASAAYFVMDEELQETLISGTHSMVCTDGSPTMRHPRGYGSFAKVIEEYVLEKNLFSLEEAVYKMSFLPAKTIGIKDRGRIEVGMKADMLIFRPEAIEEVATFENPFQLSRGFDWVMINGKLVKHGEQIEAPGAGAVLRKEL